MVTFRCIVSNNMVEFTQAVDIATTRENPAYEEIIETIKEEEKPVVKKSTKKTTTEE